MASVTLRSHPMTEFPRGDSVPVLQSLPATFNRLGQYASSPGNRAHCYAIFSSGYRKRRQ